MTGRNVLDTAKWLHENLNPDGSKAPVQLEEFTRKNLAGLFQTLGYSYGAEIGVAGGFHSKQICEQVSGVRLLCIDTWKVYKGLRHTLKQEKYDWCLETAQENLAPYNAEIIQAFSMDAVRDVELESLDFVYIDGNHSFDYVMQDIIEWSKRVRRGGIVSGHDYYRFRNAGIVPAVNVYAYMHHIKEWFLTSEKKEKSFFWVKR